MSSTFRPTGDPGAPDGAPDGDAEGVVAVDDAPAAPLAPGTHPLGIPPQSGTVLIDLTPTDAGRPAEVHDPEPAVDGQAAGSTEPVTTAGSPTAELPTLPATDVQVEVGTATATDIDVDAEEAETEADAVEAVDVLAVDAPADEATPPAAPTDSHADEDDDEGNPLAVLALAAEAAAGRQDGQADAPVAVLASTPTPTPTPMQDVVSETAAAAAVAAAADEPVAEPPTTDDGPVLFADPEPGKRARSERRDKPDKAGRSEKSDKGHKNDAAEPIVVAADPEATPALPHWTDPPAPVVVDPDATEAVPVAPSARWQDQATGWDDSRLTAPLPDHPVAEEHDLEHDEDYLTFEDLEVPSAALPKAPPRGTPDDPIKQQRAGRVPASPAATAGPAPSDVPDPGETTPVEADNGPATPQEPPPSGGGRDLRQSVQVGLGIALGALAIFLVGALTPLKWFPLLLIVPALVGSMAELFNASVRAGFRPINLVGVVAGTTMPITAYLAGSPEHPAGESGIMLVLFLTLAASMAWYLFGAGKGRPVANIAVTLLGVVYVGALGSYSGLILRAGPWPGTTSTDVQGVAFFILIALGTTMYDAGGYLLGSRIGRTPLSAASPNKTREGLAAGMVTSILTVWLVGGVFGLGVQNVTQALVLGVVLAVVAPLGDLFESMLKRDLGVKDMGSLIPQHGGLLDRLDAYLFTLPAAFYTLRMLSLL